MPNPYGDNQDYEQNPRAIRAAIAVLEQELPPGQSYYLDDLTLRYCSAVLNSPFTLTVSEIRPRLDELRTWLRSREELNKAMNPETD